MYQSYPWYNWFATHRNPALQRETSVGRSFPDDLPPAAWSRQRPRAAPEPAPMPGQMSGRGDNDCEERRAFHERISRNEYSANSMAAQAAVT
jgi:hypothetical protein